MAVTHQWKWKRSAQVAGGRPATVKMTNGATALGKTYTPVILTSNLIVTPGAAGAVWGVAIPSAAISATKVPVIVSPDVFEVHCSGALALGAAVMIAADGGVLALTGTAALCCGTIVDFAVTDGKGHIQAKFVPSSYQQAGA